MSEFNNANIIKKANVYYGGKVSSRSVTLESGEQVTLGLMTEGNYTFSTKDKEIMELLSGDMRVLLPGTDQWREIEIGTSFEVPANASFDVEVKEFADYCCSYLKG